MRSTHAEPSPRGYRVPGALVEDWEALAVGPCPAGSCVYIADIGDNNARRRRITIYRLTEPTGTSGFAGAIDAFHAVYPDGPKDAETLLLTPDGRLSIVTKGDTGPVAVYQFPVNCARAPSCSSSAPASRGPARSPRDDRVTDGAVSPDGAWVVLRGRSAIVFYRTAELMAGTWREVRRVSLAALGEPQGEGIAFGNDQTLYVTGESGTRGLAGTFGRLTCAPLRE